MIPSCKDWPDAFSYFWRRVDVRGEHECWPFKGPARRDGYGHIKLMRKVYLVHRVAYAWGHGVEPPDVTSNVWFTDECACRTCCNWRHLTTTRDPRKRNPNSLRSPIRPVTETQLATIIDLAERGRSVDVIRRFSGATKRQIMHVLENS